MAGLYQAAMNVTGVRNAILLTPAADVTPNDLGAGDTVELLIPGEITVRKV